MAWWMMVSRDSTSQMTPAARSMRSCLRDPPRSPAAYSALASRLMGRRSTSVPGGGCIDNRTPEPVHFGGEFLLLTFDQPPGVCVVVPVKRLVRRADDFGPAAPADAALASLRVPSCQTCPPERPASP